MDNARLTAWSVSELINSEGMKKNPDTVLAFLSAERLRRFEQLVKSLCGDIERGIITVRTDGMQSLCESVNDLQQRLVSAINRKTQGLQDPGRRRRTDTGSTDATLQRDEYTLVVSGSGFPPDKPACRLPPKTLF